MADDIVTRLRDDESVFVDAELLHEAATEIERLREWRTNALLALDKRENQITQLRAELHKMTINRDVAVALYNTGLAEP